MVSQPKIFSVIAPVNLLNFLDSRWSLPRYVFKRGGNDEIGVLNFLDSSFHTLLSGENASYAQRNNHKMTIRVLSKPTSFAILPRCTFARNAHLPRSKIRLLASCAPCIMTKYLVSKELYLSLNFDAFWIATVPW